MPNIFENLADRINGWMVGYLNQRDMARWKAEADERERVGIAELSKIENTIGGAENVEREVRNIPFVFYRGGDKNQYSIATRSSGYYQNSGKNAGKIFINSESASKNVPLHELQHSVSYQYGGWPNVYSVGNATLRNAAQKTRDYTVLGHGDPTAEPRAEVFPMAFAENPDAAIPVDVTNAMQQVAYEQRDPFVLQQLSRHIGLSNTTGPQREWLNRQYSRLPRGIPFYVPLPKGLK